MSSNASFAGPDDTLHANILEVTWPCIIIQFVVAVEDNETEEVWICEMLPRPTLALLEIILPQVSTPVKSNRGLYLRNNFMLFNQQNRVNFHLTLDKTQSVFGQVSANK